MLRFRHRLTRLRIFWNSCRFLFFSFLNSYLNLYLSNNKSLTKFNSLNSRETAAEENSTSYFPLLDRIADGAFDDAGTEKELYDRFLKIVHEDGHLRTPESLSSFKLSLAIRSAAPRIQAHYQYYNTSVRHSLMAAQDAACPVWVHSDGKQYCSSTLERAQQDVAGEL